MNNCIEIKVLIANWRLEKATDSPEDLQLLKEQLAEDLYDEVDYLVKRLREDDKE